MPGRLTDVHHCWATGHWIIEDLVRQWLSFHVESLLFRARNARELTLFAKRQWIAIDSGLVY
jgi:hypothetical protein